MLQDLCNRKNQQFQGQVCENRLIYILDSRKKAGTKWKSILSPLFIKVHIKAFAATGLPGNAPSYLFMSTCLLVISLPATILSRYTPCDRLLTCNRVEDLFTGCSSTTRPSASTKTT